MAVETAQLERYLDAYTEFAGKRRQSLRSGFASCEKRLCAFLRDRVSHHAR